MSRCAARTTLVLSLAFLVGVALGLGRAAHADEGERASEAQPAPLGDAAAASQAPPLAPEDRFAAAAEAMAAGEHRQAAEAFVAFADAEQGHALAADALYTAAQLYGDRLGEPARALVLYERLVASYPQSRTALAAERRAKELSQSLGPSRAGAGAQARFDEILQSFPSRGEADSIARMEELLAGEPGWSGQARARLWLGGVHERSGRYARALAEYERAARAASEIGDEEARFDAYRGAGDAALLLGRLAQAEAFYARMPALSGRAYLHADAMEKLARARLRARIYGLAWATLILALGGLLGSLAQASRGARAAVAALWPVPTEVLFMAPIAGLLIAASWTGHYAIGPVVTAILLGGLMLTWLSAAGLRAGGGGKLRPLVHAALVTVAVIALCYIAIHYNRLLDMIMETVRFGPEVS